VNHHNVKRPIRPLRLVDHLLEDGPIIIESRRPWLREDLYDLDASVLAPSATLRNLIRDREITLCLPARGYANVNGCSFHGRSVSWQLLIGIDDGVDFSRKEGPEYRDFLAGDRRMTECPA
jgi:hypothetical protein